MSNGKAWVVDCYFCGCDCLQMPRGMPVNSSYWQCRHTDLLAECDIGIHDPAMLHQMLDYQEGTSRTDMHD